MCRLLLFPTGSHPQKRNLKAVVLNKILDYYKTRFFKCFSAQMEHYEDTVIFRSSTGVFLIDLALIIYLSTWGHTRSPRYVPDKAS